MRPKLLFFVSVFRNLTLKCKKFSSLKEIVSHFRILDIKFQKKIVSLKVCDTKWLNLSLFKADKSQRSSIVSVKQRAVCIMNVWGYTEILPSIIHTQSLCQAFFGLLTSPSHSSICILCHYFARPASRKTKLQKNHIFALGPFRNKRFARKFYQEVH